MSEQTVEVLDELKRHRPRRGRELDLGHRVSRAAGLFQTQEAVKIVVCGGAKLKEIISSNDKGPKDDKLPLSP